jgi:hypothetical protein
MKDVARGSFNGWLDIDGFIDFPSDLIKKGGV